MQKNILKYTLLLGIAALWSCEPNVDEFKPSKGTADFSKFIAIGDSYTAGYTDGALGKRGQEESFSYILGKQLMYVGSSSYNQPLVKAEGSIGSALNGYYKLEVIEGSLAPVPGKGNPAILAERVHSEENQSFGVPGAKSYHLLAPGFGNPEAGIGNYNPFYTRFMSAANASVMGDAMQTQPTFISLMIGGNDVLGYALAGGEADAITPVDQFANYMRLITGSAFGNGQQGVIANVPSVDFLPYFNHILKDGHLPLVVEDDASPVGVRQLVEGEKVLLSASTMLQMGYGQSPDKPLPAKYILDLDELTAIRTATAAYNQTIKTLSDQYKLALVDLSDLLKQLSTTGLIIDGNRYTGTFVSGGVFSLDGIHTSGRGSAIIANAFIDAINAKFGATVPRANINDYDMVMFP